MTSHQRRTPQEYKDQLRELNARYEVSLREMVKSFPYAKAYPELDKYTSTFQKDESSLNALRGDLFLFRDSVEQDIGSVADEVAVVINRIKKVEKENGKLMIELQGLENQREGAIGMYDDQQEIYNFNLVRNWIHFGLIIGSGALAYKMVKGDTSSI
jgi:intein-encoded DNA endonuclease-like protein